MKAALVTLLAMVAAGGAMATAEESPKAAARGIVVLDTAGVWRMHHTLSAPVIARDEGLTPVPLTGAEADRLRGSIAADTPPPPADWAAPDFDDSAWLRGTALRACRTPLLARLCLRGTFSLTDPDRTSGLSLSAQYHGGIVVYLNGKEIARSNLAPAADGKSILAEAYPEEAYVSEKGKLLNVRGNMTRLAGDLSDETRRRYDLRTRSVRVELPKSLLRKGTNVVALEIIRAPYDKVLDVHKGIHEYKSKDETYDLSWNTCEILGVRLVAAGSAGVVANAARPHGVQVWNSDVMATDYDLDFGDAAAPLRPIRIVGARNGQFSGKVVVGSDEPLRKLRATVSDLKAADGATIAASQACVRYALPWSGLRAPLTTEFNFETLPYPASPEPLVALDESPLAEFPVREKDLAQQTEPTQREIQSAMRSGGGLTFFLRSEGQPATVFGAVVPIWVTVSVPRDARPGTYSGKLAVEAGGTQVAEVPLELLITPYLLPDPKDFRTWVEAVQSPDTLAVHYNLEMWSDRHFEMMAQSMKILRGLGSRVVYVPLVAQTNFGNAETMVRWIKKGENAYDFDFSVMDRYLDLVANHMDKPQFVVFMVWDLHLGADASGPRSQYSERAVGKSPLVTLLDRGSGKTENVHLPPYEDPGGKEPWTRLFAQLRERMRTRGLEQAMLLGMLSDAWPSKEQTEALKDISGGLPWSIAAHGGYWEKTKPLHGIADIGYHAHAFATQYGYGRSLMGWKQSALHTAFERWGSIPHTPLVRWRCFPEIGITGSTRGIARLGGDFWPVEFKDRRGRTTLAQVWARYPEADLRQLSLKTTLLVPGPEGPVAGARFEALREGLQECEARIVVEQALSDETLKARLAPDLVEQCQAMLAERQDCMWRSVGPLQVGPAADHSLAAWRALSAGVTGYAWYLNSGWQERSARLFTLAGQVQATQAAN